MFELIQPNRPTILETTLRDGSYVVDFQFTARDTENLARALFRAGIKIIEVGHGIGINASSSKGSAAESDVDYLKAAKHGAPNAAVGMFCIPGIAETDHLRACADAGLDFIRIGINVDEYRKSETFVKLARDLGLYVCSNFMKSYAMPADQFSTIAKASEEFGSQLIYLVDSAGGMLPNEVGHYIKTMQDMISVPIGFHGHNNLHLAVGNSLAALDAGATVVDTTLLGMGRSSGNAPTEIMVPLMQRHYDACSDMDDLFLLELAERVISPLVKDRWEDTEKTALGLAQVHSMYASAIRRAASESEKHHFDLIREVGKRDRLNLSPGVLTDSLAAAHSESDVANAIGTLSLLEPLDSSSTVADIVRAKKKTALPIVIRVHDGDARINARYGFGAIRITCDARFAANLAASCNGDIARIDIDDAAANKSSDSIDTLKALVDVIGTRALTAH